MVNLDTVVNIQVNKRKKVVKSAKVVEAFKEKYIRVDIDDEDDHVFQLKWNVDKYEGKFLDMIISCQYNIERDFSAVKTTQGTGQKTSVVRRSRSGRPTKP